MLRPFDVILIGVMTVAATVTYSIKHRADEKLQEIRRLEAEIKLEKDTIDLLKADWALLTQPNRLQKLIDVYARELELRPTEPTQLSMPSELPMLRTQLPQPEVAEGAGANGGAASSPYGTVIGGVAVPAFRPDMTTTGSVNR